MKKLLLFFTVFLVFGFLSAEEVQVYKDGSMILLGEKWTEQESEVEPEPEPIPEPEPEKEPEKEENQSCGCDVSRETSEKPKFFYIQPALGFGSGLTFYRPTVALDAGFLVGSTPEVNYYVGLDLDLWWLLFSYDLYDPMLDFSVMASGVFDVMTGNNPYIRSVSLWISVGLDMMYGQEIHDERKYDAAIKYDVAWGTGVDLVFRNYLVLKLGLDSFWGFVPDCTFAVGYRF